MTGFLLAVLLSFAPNGWVLAPSFSAPEVRRQLPVEGLLEILPRLWVVYHEDGDAAMASFVPAKLVSDGAAPSVSWMREVALRLRIAQAGPRRLLPGLRVPRIFLYAPYYLTPDGPRSALEMPLDVAQYLASALLEASLALDPPAGFEARVARYGPSIPAAERREAYVSALEQFGSDAFSVAGELRRSLARQRAAGHEPCGVVDRPGTLYHQWGRIFESVGYRGLYSPEGGRPGDWSLGPPLSKGDKRYLVEHLFAGFWSGDVRRDFALDCP